MGQLRQIFLNNKLYLKNLFFTYFSQGVTAISLIILTPLLTKYLGLHEFGIYGVILNVIAFSAIFDLGLNTGLLRKYILGQDSNETLIKNIFSFFLLLGLFLFPVYIFVFHSVINNLSYSTLVIIAILSTIVIVQNIIILFFDTLIQGLNFIYVSKLFRSIKLICEFIATICLLHKLNLPLLLLITTTINVFYIIVLYVYTRKNNHIKLSFQPINWVLLIMHFKYSLWYFLTSLASVLVFNTQIVLINYLIGGSEAARFLIVTRFFDIIRIAMTNFTQVLTPKIIYIEVENNWNKIRKLFINVLSRISILTLLLSTCLYFFGAMIFEKWSKLSDASTLSLFKIYIVFISLIIIDNVSFIFLSALKLNKTTTIVSIFQGCLTLILTMFFITKYGIIGAIYASLLSFTLTNMLFNPIYLVRVLNKKLV
jgi:O-antigen/teichoic acid export membrane protein